MTTFFRIRMQQFVMVMAHWSVEYATVMSEYVYCRAYYFRKYVLCIMVGSDNRLMINIYVGRKAWIRTIHGCNCAKRGSVLRADNP